MAPHRNKTSYIVNTMDSYKVNERAWNAILHAVKQLRAEGHTLDAIGHQLKIGRATVKKWIDSDIGGERTSFRDMVRYLDVLNVPLTDVFGVPIETTNGCPQWEATNFEKHLAAFLKQGATMFGKRPETLSRHAFGDNTHSVAIREMLDGKQQVSVEIFYKLCKAIGLESAEVLKRVAELAADEGGEDSSRRTA